MPRRLSAGSAWSLVSGRPVPVGLAMIALYAGFRAWALWGSWFYFDDIAFMSRAMNQPLDSAYLLESYGGHLMPGGFLVTWLLTDVAAYSWTPWAVVLLVMQTVAALGMLRLLLSMFGRTPFVLVLLAGYLTYVFTLSAGIWWAAGINQLPMQIALVFGLHATIEYLRHRRMRSLMAALLWTSFGMLFYEKTLLLLGVYALVGLGWFCTGHTLDRLGLLWSRYRPGVVAFGVLGIGYLALYVHYGLDFAPGDANSQPWSPIAYNLIGVALLPGVAGGPLEWQPLTVGAFADPRQLVILVAWAAVAALVVHAYRTRTISRRAWSLLGFTLLCNVALLASARANVVGPDIAREYRYQTESAAMFVISVGLAFLPLRGAAELNARRPEATAPPERPRVVALIAAAVVVAALVSSVRYVQLWQDGNDSAAYFASVERTLADAPDQPVPLVDLGIPQTLLWAYRYPENAYSHVFRHLADRTDYPRSSTDSLFMFDDRGRLSPVIVEETRLNLPGSGCGYLLTGERTTIPLDGQVIGGGWWLRVSYASPEAVSLHLTAGEEEHDLELPAGLHNVFVQAAGAFDAVELSDYPSESGLCVTALTLGLPLPAAPSASTTAAE